MGLLHLITSPRCRASTTAPPPDRTSGLRRGPSLPTGRPTLCLAPRLSLRGNGSSPPEPASAERLELQPGRPLVAATERQDSSQTAAQQGQLVVVEGKVELEERADPERVCGIRGQPELEGPVCNHALGDAAVVTRERGL